MRARLLLATALATLAFPVPAWGQAPKRLLVVDPLPKGAAERIAGQIADLPWTMEHVRGARPGAAVDARVAEGLAKERGVGAVLWVEEDGSGFALHLLDAEKHQVVERQLPRAQGASPLARSAALEALALAVRSGLSTLSAEAGASSAAMSASATTPEGDAGGSGGSTATQSAAGEKSSATDAAQHDAAAAQHAESKPPEPKQPPEREADDDDATEPDEDEHEAPEGGASTGSAPALILAAGWAAALDGQSPIQHGPSARLGIALNRLELALEGELALPEEVRDEQVHINLQRSVALASVSLEIVHTARAQLAIAAGAGIASFARDTQQVASVLRATAPNDVQTFAAELEARGRVSLISTAAFVLDLEFAAGVLALPAAPTLQYQGAQGRVEHALWSVQPQLRIGPVVRVSL